MYFEIPEYEGKIFKLSINDPNEILMKEGFEEVGSLVVDWVTGNVYFVVKGYVITVCDSDIVMCVEIYRGPKDVKINAMALDSLNGYVWDRSR